MPITIILDERNPRDRGFQDMLRRVSGLLLGREFEVKGLAADLWFLVVFYDSGVIDHPLGADGGNAEGKASVPWYDRKHEVLGYGATPSDACAGILRRGKSARLKAIRRADAESGKMCLLFKDLDTNLVYYPDQLFVHPS